MSFNPPPPPIDICVSKKDKIVWIDRRNTWAVDLTPLSFLDDYGRELDLSPSFIRDDEE